LEKKNKLPAKKYKVVHRDWLTEYLSSFETCKYTQFLRTLLIGIFRS